VVEPDEEMEMDVDEADEGYYEGETSSNEDLPSENRPGSVDGPASPFSGIQMNHRVFGNL